MKFLLIVTIFVYSVYADKRISPDLEPLTDEIVKAINELKTSWKAGKNFGESTSIEMNRLIAPLNESFHDDVPIVQLELKQGDFPNSFDARKFWPECPSIGKVYDQRRGVPSWVYPTVGQIADRLCIEYDIQIDVEATVERMARVNGGFNSEYNSADIGKAFKYWSKKGILTIRSVNGTDCLPFVSCEIPEIQFDKHFKVDVKYPKYINDKKRDIMLNGPLTIRMDIHSDFPSYQLGVYHHTSDKILGTHVIKLIGWGYASNEFYWLATNSWGTQWGEKGLFRLNLGSNQFGSSLFALSASFPPMEHTNFIPQQDQMFDLA